MGGKEAGESQRQPATAYAAFLSSFQAEPAHQGKHRRAALPGTSVAHKRDERPATRCSHGDEPGRVRYGYARDSPWAPPGAAASRPLANGSQAHRSRTMHLVGPTIAERAVSRRHLGEHPARPRGRWRRGLRPTPTARGPAGTRSASCHAAQQHDWRGHPMDGHFRFFSIFRYTVNSFSKCFLNSCTCAHSVRSRKPLCGPSRSKEKCAQCMVAPD